MKTGNGASPNPRKIWQGGMKKDASNLVKKAVGTAFSAKRDSFKGKK